MSDYGVPRNMQRVLCPSRGFKPTWANITAKREWRCTGCGYTGHSVATARASGVLDTTSRKPKRFKKGQKPKKGGKGKP